MLSIKHIPRNIDYVVVHGKKIKIGDHIEVYKGCWQGVFKVEDIQQGNRWLPCMFRNSRGIGCWPMAESFRKFQQTDIATEVEE